MNHTIRRRAGVALIAAVLVTTLGACRLTGWDDLAGRSAGTSATTWLKAQQQPDGGFEMAGFSGFETSDAIIAIAEDAQQQSSWNKGQALAAVTAATTAGGKSPLDAIDDFSEGALNAGQAAKVATLVALPLGLAPTAFDPQGDGAVDLIAIVDAGAQPNGSYGTLGATLAAATAKRAGGGTVPAATVTFVRAAQKADGSWDYLGSPSGTGSDVDTTAAAIQALVASGASAADTDVREGLAFLASSQAPSGSWASFGTADPNSTAAAVMALTEVGYDPASSCWRDQVAPALAGTPYGSPTLWLRTQQASDGHIISPNDEFGLNTYATSQTIQALRRSWMPPNAASAVTCP